MHDSVRSGRQAVDRINWPSAYLQSAIPISHSLHMPLAAAVCPIHLSLAGWVNEEQLTAAAAEHGHGGDLDRARL